MNLYSAGVIVLAFWFLRSAAVILIYRKIYGYLADEESRWRDRIFFNTLAQSYRDASRARSGQASNILLNECRLALNGLFAAADLIQSLMSLMLIIASALLITPWIIVPAVIAVMPGAIIFRRSRHKAREMGILHMHHNQEYANIVAESQRCAKELRALNLRQSVFDDASTHGHQSSKMFGLVNIVQYETRAIIEFVFVMAIFASAFLLRDVLANDANFASNALFLIGAAFRAMPYLTRASMAATSLSSHQKEMAQVAAKIESLGLGDMVFPNVNDVVLPEWQHLELEGISFSYSSKKVIDRVDLVIERGQKVVLCGPSGHGKSTLLDILVGLLIPDSGAVKLDGIDIKTIGIERWLTAIGYVSQHPYIFHASIGDNLKLKRKVTDEQLQQACRVTGFDQVLASMPEGLNTLVGEQGIGLSGGQQEKLAMTRVLLQGYKLLFLDEPTSAMDKLSEETLARLLNVLAAKGTTIVIATHSAKLAEIGDLIFSVAEGRIDRIK